MITMTIAGIVVIFIVLLIAQHLLNWGIRTAGPFNDSPQEFLCWIGLVATWVLFGVMVYHTAVLF